MHQGPRSLPGPLDRWIAEQLPDGSTRLFETRRERLLQLLTRLPGYAICSFFAIEIARSALHTPATAAGLLAVLTAAALGLLAIAASAVWLAFGHEEWLAGPDCLPGAAGAFRTLLDARVSRGDL